MASSQSNQLYSATPSRYGDVTQADSELQRKGKAKLPIDDNVAREVRDLLTDNSDPQWMRFCPGCQNISQVFATTPVEEVIREPWSWPRTWSKNSLQYHSNIEQSSETCHLCALMGACVAHMTPERMTVKQFLDGDGPIFGETFKQFLGVDGSLFGARLRGVLDRDGYLFRDKGKIEVFAEEVYGTGKLISHIKVSVFMNRRWNGPQYPDEGERFRIYSESGMRFITVPLGNELLRTYTESDNRTARKVLGRPAQPHANSSRTLQLARNWVDECYRTHLECRWSDQNTEGDPPLPSRVIDIGETEEDRLRILLPKGRVGKWVALSHRWPSTGVRFMKATRSNIEDLQCGFLPGSLPSTFQDAIKITRALGIRFLWIDSLCILQDSLEDWNEEAGRMAEIFANAYVTIAAAATKDCFGGILVQREWAPRSKPCKLPVPSKEGLGSVFIDFCIDKNDNSSSIDSKGDINYLKDRAWCFQECRLSHRLLTFDRLQMSYTCLRHGLHEDRHPVPYFIKEYKNDFLPHLKGTLSNDTTRLHDTLKIWYRILSDYTTCNLTFSSDKLVALSGIANVVGNFIQDKYYAGLWHKNLPQALLWSPYDEEDLPYPGYKATKAPRYRAPSWSWASIDSRISSFICRETMSHPAVSTVLEISTEPCGPDIYGQVTNGHLVIRGSFKKAICGEKLTCWPQQPQLCWEQKTDQESDDVSHCVFDHSIPAVGSTIWCLQITTKYGLILSPLPDNEGLYVRVGIFHLRSKDVNNGRVPSRFSVEDVQTVVII